MKQKVLFVLFGATGDLAKKKLFPALYRMHQENMLEDFAVIGVGRRALEASSLVSGSKRYMKDLDETSFASFVKRLYYAQVDFSHDEDFSNLATTIKDVESKHHLSGNRLFYLATLPDQFASITDNLKKQKLCDESSPKGWKRVVYEKPFGHNLSSAKSINACIKQVFREEQIFRIDHYLGKELVGNISTLRFTNKVIEPIWDHEEIDHVQILMTENFGTEGRAGFYDKYGALRDVVQNHLLQLLALVGMESPKTLQGEDIRNEKIKVLKKTKIAEAVFAQYEGYAQEEGVAKDSKTETLVALKAMIANKRWKGVPFYLLAGKHLREREALIYIQFKQPPCLLFDGVCNFTSNYLKIQIQPDEGIHLQLNARSPGKQGIVPIHLDFSHAMKFGPNTPDAYENLLKDVVSGDQSVFVREDEIEEQWRIIAPYLYKEQHISLYAPGHLPEAAKKFAKKNNIDWFIGQKD